MALNLSEVFKLFLARLTSIVAMVTTRQIETVKYSYATHLRLYANSQQVALVRLSLWY